MFVRDLMYLLSQQPQDNEIAITLLLGDKGEELTQHDIVLELPFYGVAADKVIGQTQIWLTDENIAELRKILTKEP